MTTRWTIRSVVVLIAGLALGPIQAQAPKVLEFRTQEVGKTTYFQVRIERPADLRLPDDRRTGGRWDERAFDLLPRLVPQDDKSSAVYLSGRGIDALAGIQRLPGEKGAPVDAIEFVGKVQGKGETKLLLLYPKDSAPLPKGKQSLAEMLKRHGDWVETALTLDFAKADKVAVPAAKRKAPEPGKFKNNEVPGFNAQPIDNNDLEGLWALGQLAGFVMLEAQSPEFGFYPFARQTTSQKYTVFEQPQFRQWGNPDRPFHTGQLYEITTGAAAITETLALNRLIDRNFRNKEEARTVDISRVVGIDIAEHPWLKMMNGQKPSPEPLAKLVPSDNYYIHFKNIAKFLETGDLFEQWGTSLSRALEANSRDFAIKEKMEQQLCLKSTKLARVFGPAVVKSMALTGSDPYVREGSDLTIVFHVANKELFLAATQPQLQQTLANFGGKLKVDTHQEINIESFVTPLREVSFHRAMFDEYIVYSNSPVGIRRIIDTYKGKLPALADSLDYQYMRTIFRLEDPLEDGFVFLSDRFIRNLVGPATRIKERRRLEALASLSMVTNGALFTAWETGKLPADNAELLSYTGLTANQLFSPDGDAAFWNGQHKVAVSSFYNTQTFATPLIEIPINAVSVSEQREYEEFRLRYLGLWRQYFDPIGIRIGLNKKEVRWETYILPLVKNTEYNELRRMAGDGTVKLDPAGFSDKTIFQFMSHISPNARERQEFGRVLSGFSRDIPGLSWLGNWFTVRVDDSPVYGKMLERMIMRDMGLVGGRDYDEEVRLAMQMPVTLGVEIKNPLVFATVLAAGKKAITDALPGAVEWEPIKAPYKETTIVQIKATQQAGLNNIAGSKEPLTPSLYYALVDGAWYISLKQECIHDEIDRSAARKQAQKDPATIDINTSLYASPKAAVHTREFMEFYFEWETHRRAVSNMTLLYPLYHGGVITAADDGATIQAAALKYLGFIPVSPDYSPYSYNRKTDEVVNRRHGSIRQPSLQKSLDANSPLAVVLEQFTSLRADLRFREDGINTVVTFTRK
jgi:hypothetical protein